MEDLCRICRKSCFHESVPIFSDHKGVPLKQMLTKTCPIDITFDDPVSQLLPQSICTDCLEVVTAAYNLQQVCIESDQYFRSLVSSDQIVVKTEKMDIKEEEVDTLGSDDRFEEQETEHVAYLVPLVSKMSQRRMTVRTRTRREKSNLLCDLCGATEISKDDMETHMFDDHLKSAKKSNSKKKSNHQKCMICGLKLSDKHNLYKHLMLRHGEIIKCEKCDENFQDMAEMKYHVMIVHDKRYRLLAHDEIEHCLKCCVCEVNHATEADLMVHLSSHEPALVVSKKTSCHLCPKVLRDYKQFINHAKYHAQPHTHECLTCRKKFPKGEKLASHVKYHNYYDNCKVQCKKCFQKFDSAKDLEVHDKVKHNKETLFICPICAKSSTSANGLDQHIRYVHGNENEKQFKCKSCSKAFINKSQLSVHETTHSKKRPHVCDVCGNSFKSPYGLTKHKKIHDPNIERNHACSQCPMTFTTKYRLNQHSLTHSGLKPHECKFCDRAYACKGDLVKHMQKLHVGDAIYQCNKCPRGFRLIVELREHQAEHAEDRK